MRRRENRFRTICSVFNPLTLRPLRFSLQPSAFSLYPLAAGLTLLFLLTGPACASEFAFGNGKIKSGWIQVSPTNFYSPEVGHGFEPGADVVAAAGCVTSTNPFYFSVKLPEGNYRVSAIRPANPRTP
jgi:hypothetical protein